MEHDLIISGGTVVDGTGGPSIKADVGVKAGRISQIGDLTGDTAAETIDATNRVVSPGFVDLHTHLDAQIGWDPMMTSTSYHGVTTALIGNCGVTFAPCGPKNRRYLAELMEAVEDIAADAIMDGLPWDWSSYGEYLDSVQALKPALNIVGLVGHSAVRYEAMGDRSMDEGEQPTDKELAHITKMVRESVEAGAVGFSTSRFLQHTVPDGRCTPGTWADLRETKAIQEAVVAGGGVGAVYQSANDMATRYQTELQMFRDGMDAGCQVLFSGGAGGEGDGGGGGGDDSTPAADTTAPGAPSNLSVTTAANDNTPTITGLAEGSSTVKLYNGSTLISTVGASSSGSFSITVANPLADGTYSFTVTATDSSNNVSNVSTIAHTINTSGSGNGGNGGNGGYPGY
mgnify:CR=1 FL=1